MFLCMACINSDKIIEVLFESNFEAFDYSNIIHKELIFFPFHDSNIKRKIDMRKCYEL